MMAVLSTITAVEAPPNLRASVLAAAIVLGLKGFGLDIALRPSPAPMVCEQIMTVPVTATPVADLVAEQAGQNSDQHAHHHQRTAGGQR